MKKKFLCVILSVLTAFTCINIVGCNDDADAEKNNSSKLNYRVVENQYIVRGGFSDYSIVIPSEPDNKEEFAASEFSNFMHQATGSQLRITTDVRVRENSKVISFGRTKQFAERFPGEDLSALENTTSSYFIATDDDDIYIVSDDSVYSSGCLWGAYDLLNALIGYTYYHNSEIYFNESDTVNLVEYDKQIVSPSFDERTISTRYIYANDLHNIRLRLVNFSKGTEWDYQSSGHGAIQKYIDPEAIDPESEKGETYYETHRDWFINGNGASSANMGMIDNDFCYTAHGNDAELDALVSAVAGKLESFIANNKGAKYFMFGQEDNHISCGCAACREAVADWAGGLSGLQIAFMNRVVEEVEDWISENQPGREVNYVIYAYQPSEKPPVKEVDGEYVEYSDRVIPHEKLRVMFCPIELNFAYSFDSPVSDNQTYYEYLQGWSSICGDNLFVYTYNLNMYNYFVNFNNFGSTTSMLRDYCDNDVRYLLIQGISDSNATCFDEMRSYVESSLLWDVNRDYDELVRDFMRHYYGDAALETETEESWEGVSVSSQLMYEYYNMLRNRYALYYAENPGKGSIRDNDLANTDIFPRAVVENLNDVLMEAVQALEPLKAEDPARYTELESRIMKEYLSIIYLRMQLYPTTYSENEKNDMQRIWSQYVAYYGLTGGGEGGAMPDLFD